MENFADWEQKNLVNELTLGRELAKQLQIHLNVPSSSRETREILVQKILASYEKALSMLATTNSSLGVNIGLSESPPSLNGSPRSEDSDRDQEHKSDGSRKRKSVPRWTQQVRVSPGVGLEGPLDDGFSWRKYGQKDILGAKYPRGYYRCTHRNVQGCLATKQVQRTDEDPTIYEITYRGRHTCSQASHLLPPHNSHVPEIQEPNNNNNNMDRPQQQNQQHQDHRSHQQPSQELLLNFRTGLKVITENLESQEQFPSFHFPSTSNVNQPGNQVFSPSMVENSFMGKFSPSFVSPSTSGTNYFPANPSGTQHSFGGNQNFHSSESELTEIISAATSATNSPTVGFDFPFGNANFDPNFSFGNPGFLP